MRRRNLFAVLILPIITFGIYSIFWFAENRGQMNKLGASVPTTWLYIIPIINIYYLWKFGVGLNHITKSMPGWVAFLILALLGPIGMMIVQSSFNYVSEKTAPQPAL